MRSSVPRVAFEDVRVGVERAGEHAQVGQLADVGVGRGLEHLSHQRRIGVRRDVLAVLGLDDVLRRGGEEARDGVEEVRDANRRGGGRGEHRRQVARGDAEHEALAHVVRREIAVFEVLGQEIFVVLGDGFEELCTERLDLRLHVVRDGRLAALVAQVRLHVHEVDHAFEGLLGADGKLHGDATLAQLRLHLLQRAVEVGVLTVEAVDQDGPRHATVVDHVPGLLGAHLHTGGGTDDDDGGIGGGESAVGVADEVGVAGCVDQVDFVAVPFAGEEGGVDADFAFDLVRVEV